MEQIDVSEPFVLLGVSYGGIIAQEIAALHRPKHLILISTITSTAEISPWYRFLFCIKLHHLTKLASKLAYWLPVHWLLGMPSRTARRIIRSLLRETDPALITQALDRVYHWRKEPLDLMQVRLHGGQDAVISIPAEKVDHYFPDSGHLVCLTEYREINKILLDLD